MDVEDKQQGKLIAEEKDREQIVLEREREAYFLFPQLFPRTTVR